MAEREHKEPTLQSVDLSFRLINLPPELQTKIVVFAVYEDRVTGLTAHNVRDVDLCGENNFAN